MYGRKRGMLFVLYLVASAFHPRNRGDMKLKFKNSTFVDSLKRSLTSSSQMAEDEFFSEKVK